MKKFLPPLLSLLGVLLVSLFFLGRSVRTIESAITIPVPPDVVWNRISDFNSWTEWNSTVTQASGKSALHEQLKIGIRGPDGNEASLFQPVVTKLEAPHVLRWEATMGADFIFFNAREFRVKTTPNGSQLIQTEEFSGMMVPLMWSQLQDFVSEHLNATNQALKNSLIDR